MIPAERIDAEVWLAHAWRNRLQSMLLLAVMAGFVALLGWLVWGRMGLMVLLGITTAFVLLNPGIAPWLVMRMYRARRISEAQSPQLHRLLRELTQRAGLDRVPELFHLPSSLANAFAVGSPDHSAIAVSDGLLRQLNLRELAGVLAHEISHIRNNDLWVMGLADLFSRATSLLSLFGQLLLLISLPLWLSGMAHINWLAILLLIGAPQISALAQLALSRTREYHADLNAARLTGDPEGLASALARLEQVGGWVERIFTPSRQVPEPSLLRTHPATEDRIQRLLELKRQLPAFNPPGHAIPRLQIPHTLVSRRPRWHVGGMWY